VARLRKIWYCRKINLKQPKENSYNISFQIQIDLIWVQAMKSLFWGNCCSIDVYLKMLRATFNHPPCRIVVKCR
jgi:hypothetical protein